MKAILLAATLLLAVQASGQTGSAVVEGVIRRVDTGAALTGVRVELVRAGSNTNALLATTNALGEFVFRAVATGSYWLTARREGYLRPDRGAGPASISVGPGEQIRNVDLALIPGGSIAGRVLDSEGRPISGTTIRAMRLAYRSGRRLLEQAPDPGDQVFRTDAQGQYRIFWLSPGEYTVRAEDFSTFSPPALSRRGALKVPIPTYFPGTTSAEAAGMIMVRPGQEVRVEDLIVRTTSRRGVTLSGTVVNELPGKANLESLSVFLTTRELTAIDPVQRIPAILLDGKFELPGVEPGSYELTMISTNGVVHSPAARASVQVGRQALENIVLTFAGGSDVALRVTLQERPDGLNTVPFRFGLRAAVDGYSSEGPLNLSGQTTFGFVQPGSYRLAISGLPDSAYVADVRQGARPISGHVSPERMNTGVRLLFPSQPEPPVEPDLAVIVGEGSPDPIDVTLGFDSATVTGVVRDSQGPVAEAQVALVPQSSGPIAGFLYKSVRTDQNGRFILQGIAPGGYTLYSWESAPANAWENAEFLAPFAARGQSLRLDPRSNVNVPLDLIPVDP